MSICIFCNRCLSSFPSEIEMAKEQEYLIWYKFRVRPDFSRLGQSDKKKEKKEAHALNFLLSSTSHSIKKVAVGYQLKQSIIIVYY